MIDWKKMFAEWKLRFDIAVSFLVFINFFLLSITASVPIKDFLLARFGWKIEMYSIVATLVICIIFGTFLAGFVLDKIFKYWENMSEAQNIRNPQISEILENTRKILRREK
jgi:hypothetical protein